MADPDFEVLKKNAEWANRFDAGTTNLAQRARHAADKELYAGELIARQEQQMLDNLRSDKTAQDFYFKQQDMKRKAELDQFGMGLRESAEQRASALHPLRMEAEVAKAAAANALETVRLKKEARDAAAALRVTSDTDALEEGMFNLLETAKPGSKLFAEGALYLIAKHPYVPADVRKTWMQQADIDGDPDQIMRELARLGPDYELSVAVSPTGKWSGKGVQKQPPKQEVATVTETIDETGQKTGTSIRRPATPADLVPRENKTELLTQHNLLETELNKKGFQPKNEVWKGEAAKLNAIKQQLGYDTIDLETGKMVPAVRNAAPATTPAPAGGAPDRLALARRAIDDPNASEAHKAAAKRLLGL